MKDNDFIVMEQAICPVCGVKHSHNMGILIDKRLKDIPKDKRVTGYGLCKEHQKLLDDGYVALIAVNNAPTQADNAILKFEEADRTGDLMHLRKTVFNEMFNAPISDEQEFVFIDTEVFNMLVKANEENDKEVA